MSHGEIGKVGPIERATGGGVAPAIVSEHRAIAVFHLDCGLKRNEPFHPAVERNLGRGKGRGHVLARGKRGLQPADGFDPQRRHRDRKLGRFVLDGVEPVQIGTGILEQPVA